MNIHVRQIKAFVEERLSAHIDLSDLPIGDAHRKPKLLTRGLAGLALMRLADLSAEDACRCVTDGADDNGLDAIFVSPTDNRIYLVQAKWNDSGSKTIDVGDLHKFIKGAKDVLNSNWKAFNSRIKTHSKKVDQLLLNPSAQVRLVIVFPSTQPLSEHCSDLLDEFLEEVNDPSDVLFVDLVTLASLKALINEVVNGTTGESEADIHEWGEVAEPFPAVYGQISCADLASWYDLHASKLFSPNIRSFLQATPVNQAIQDTLLNSHETFWYVNNGVTAVCSNFKRSAKGGTKRNAGRFTFSNLRIVNGAQTVGSIHAAFQRRPEPVKAARVSIKVISIGEAPLGFEAEITQKSNTQNRVEARDFAALDENQFRLKQELAHQGWTYVYKAGESVGNPASGFNFEEAAVALACNQSDITFAVLAKRNLGVLLDRASTPYSTLFSDRLKGKTLITCVERMRLIETQLAKLRDREVWRARQVLIHGNRVLAHLAMQKFAKDERLDSTKLAQYLDKAAKQSLAFIDKSYPDSYLAVFFKNTDKCREMVSSMATTRPVAKTAHRS